MDGGCRLVPVPHPLTAPPIPVCAGVQPAHRSPQPAASPFQPARPSVRPFLPQVCSLLIGAPDPLPFFDSVAGLTARVVGETATSGGEGVTQGGGEGDSTMWGRHILADPDPNILADPDPNFSHPLTRMACSHLCTSTPCTEVERQNKELSSKAADVSADQHEVQQLVEDHRALQV